MVTIDTDGPHDPADIPQLVGPIRTGEADNGERQPLHEWKQEGYAPLSPPGASDDRAKKG